MPGLKEIRTRISSIKTTRQVTSAMKMVSAAKLKKAQDAILHFRPYASKLQEILHHLAASMDCHTQSPFCAVRPVEKVLVVVITSNRGLCGGFNLNAVRKAAGLVYEKYLSHFEKGNVDFFAIGKQGERQLSIAGMKITEKDHAIWSHFNYETSTELALKVLDGFVGGRYDKVYLVYNEFVNAGVQRPVVVDYLPVEVPADNQNADGELTIYEPSKADIALELIPRMLKTKFFKALLDSNAAEHGARMTAMHMATDNATELIGDLTLQYNKARQAAITKEILEITAGAEALRG